METKLIIGCVGEVVGEPVTVARPTQQRRAINKAWRSLTNITQRDY